LAFEKTGLRLEIQVIADGMQALSYFNAASSVSGPDCDLVLLDLNVPIINGFEILERIKSQRHLMRIPVIIFSSSSSNDDIERCYQAGANSYFCKPGALSEFFEMVERMAAYWLEWAKLPSKAKASALKLSSRT
jgi:CheY-like chemotaxis protein